MQLEWSTHSHQLVEAVGQLLSQNLLTDVTLSAGRGGRSIKAHRIILSAASTFFKDVLTDNHEPGVVPIVYLKDVNFNQLECLIQFIYHGRTEVPGTDLSAFLNLASELGVSGFNDDEGKRRTTTTPTKRKIKEEKPEAAAAATAPKSPAASVTSTASTVIQHNDNKENLLRKMISNSVPASLDETQQRST